MPLLSLDTSTGPASAAIISEDGHVIAQFEDGEAMRQSQYLVANVDRLVRGTLSDYKELSAIVVTIGPGGFTGIRIAIAAARGLALAANLPIIGISTLEAFAWRRLSDAPIGTKAACMVDAYRGQAYCQAFEREATKLKSLADAKAIDISNISEFLEQYPMALAVRNFALGEAVDSQEELPPPYAALAGAYAAFLLRHEPVKTLAASRPTEATYIRPPDAKPQKSFLSTT